MSEAKRERPGPMAAWNEAEMCHWLRLVDLAEAAKIIEALAGEREEAREAAGRLLFRFAPGLEGERWREAYPWLQAAEEAARTLWEGRP